MKIAKPRYSATVCPPQFVEVCRDGRISKVAVNRNVVQQGNSIHRLSWSLSEGRVIMGGWLHTFLIWIQLRITWVHCFISVRNQVIVSDVRAVGSLLWMQYSSVRTVNISALNILQKRNTEASSSAGEKIKIWSIISEETTRREKYDLRGQLIFVFTPMHVNDAYLIYVRGLILCAQRHRRQALGFKVDPNRCMCPYSPNYETNIMVEKIKNRSCFREYTSGEQTARCTKSTRNGKICLPRVAYPNLINGFPWIWWWECYFFV
jgi:hypothetical protein